MNYIKWGKQHFTVGLTVSNKTESEASALNKTRLKLFFIPYKKSK